MYLLVGSTAFLPLLYLLSKLLLPPQCPDGYTQQQVDAAGCIVGANIGGTPTFILAAVFSWTAIIMLTKSHMQSAKARKLKK